MEIISRSVSHFDLSSESKFPYHNITIERCIETQLCCVLSLNKESKNSLKSLPLYLEVEDLVRAFKDLGKIEHIPYCCTSKQQELLRKEIEKGVPYS